VGVSVTFGIDIASPQRDIDIARAKTEGAEFVIVKMGGLNVSPQYVAPYYRAQVDRVVAAGLPKGHYYLIGRGQTPEQQAEFFAANLHSFDAGRDVLALDNEALDSNGTRWGDADAARFVRRLIQLTGVPAGRVWHYAGAADYRATGSWPELAALGVRFWWAAYGSYPTGHTPDHEPSLQGSIPRCDVHQYSSKVAVAGHALDGNYSPHSVAALFGGGTMEDQMRQYIAANRKPVDAATWDQMCGSLMFRFNSWRGWKTQPTRDISSAYRAAMGSGWLNTDLTRAPVGAFHFFDIAGAANGHVMQDARGGGLVCLSTGYALSESLGNAIGFQSVPGYIAAKGARYLGWATNYAGGTINTSGLAGLNVRPITPQQQQEEEDYDMRAIRDENGSIAVVGWVEFAEFSGEDQVGAGAYVKAFGPVRQVTNAEYQRLKTDAISRAARLAQSIDVGALANTVGAQAAAAVRVALTGIEFDGDVEAIAAGVERRLADDFVKVNANIDDQPTTFDITPS
jgi:hypothetical protein